MIYYVLDIVWSCEFIEVNKVVNVYDFKEVCNLIMERNVKVYYFNVV